MKLSSIPQLYRDLNRSIEIIAVLSKYGLADWIQRLELDFARGLFRNPNGQLLADLTLEQRVRLALTELGPTFIKLGQMLSTRADLVGVALAEELTDLQTNVPADSTDSIKELLAAEIGQPPETVFALFQPEPLASASIGQVHRARLHSGQDVAVKVQHPGIRQKIRVDLEILAGLAELAERVPELQSYRPRQTAAEFRRSLLRELDFGREERNLIEFTNNFADDPTVQFPRPFTELCTGKILTMEFLSGTKIADATRLRAEGHDLHDLARQGAEIFLRMIFEHSFYHADPHPGNILVLPGGTIGVIDCGMVGRVDEALREDIEELLLAISRDDVQRLYLAVLRIGSAPSDLDQGGLQYDLSEFVSHYAHVPINQLDLGAALNEMTSILRRYHILLPPPLAMLIKALVMLEGTAKLLNPQLNLIELIEPYQRKLAWRRISPARQWQRAMRVYREWAHFGEILPKNIIELMQQVQSGSFEVHLEHEGLEPSVNRLVLGLLASALFVGSCMLWASNIPPMIYDVSIPGAVGCLASVTLGLRLFWAIRKSGRLDRKPRQRQSMRAER